MVHTFVDWTSGISTNRIWWWRPGLGLQFVSSGMLDKDTKMKIMAQQMKCYGFQQRLLCCEKEYILSETYRYNPRTGWCFGEYLLKSWSLGGTRYFFLFLTCRYWELGQMLREVGSSCAHTFKVYQILGTHLLVSIHPSFSLLSGEVRAIVFLW